MAMSPRSLVALLLTLMALVSSTKAFGTRPMVLATRTNKVASVPRTQLAERRWNFNEGRSPWGLKKNAEIWNGRVAQVLYHTI
jgi:hypothetical protein